MSSKPKFGEHHGQPFLVQAAQGFLESVPAEDTPESLYEKQELILKEELARLMNRLPQKEAEAIMLWVHGMTQAQIAERDGVTQAAISIRAKRGMEKLFEMRDRGEIGTLKVIWDGLHGLRDHINQEIALERGSDSDVSLPLGESVGTAVGESIGITVGEAIMPAASAAWIEDQISQVDAAKNADSAGVVRRKRRSNTGSGNGLNQKETAVLGAIKSAMGYLHISNIESAASLTNLEVRNSLRKLVRNDLVCKLGRGRYSASTAGQHS